MVGRSEYNPFSPPRQGGYTSSERIHDIWDRIIVTNTTQSARVRIVVATAMLPLDGQGTQIDLADQLFNAKVVKDVGA
jgi:hypothetical protein